jgi:hypothetical protein
MRNPKQSNLSPAQRLTQDRAYVRSSTPKPRLELMEQIRFEMHGEEVLKPMQKVVRFIRKF